MFYVIILFVYMFWFCVRIFLRNRWSVGILGFFFVRENVILNWDLVIELFGGDMWFCILVIDGNVSSCSYFMMLIL